MSDKLPVSTRDTPDGAGAPGSSAPSGSTKGAKEEILKEKILKILKDTIAAFMKVEKLPILVLQRRVAELWEEIIKETDEKIAELEDAIETCKKLEISIPEAERKLAELKASLPRTCSYVPAPRCRKRFRPFSPRKSRFDEDPVSSGSSGSSGS